MLTQKYGAPAASIEEFPSYPNIKDEVLKFMYVSSGQCEYNTLFETPNGRITLFLDHTDSECYVCLSYKDKINGEIIKAKVIDDL